MLSLFQYILMRHNLAVFPYVLRAIELKFASHKLRIIHKSIYRLNSIACVWIVNSFCGRFGCHQYEFQQWKQYFHHKKLGTLFLFVSFSSENNKSKQRKKQFFAKPKYVVVYLFRVVVVDRLLQCKAAASTCHHSRCPRKYVSICFLRGKNEAIKIEVDRWEWETDEKILAASQFEMQ